MRIITRMVAAGAVAAAAAGLVVAPAMADPVNHSYKSVTPKVYDVVGVGSDTTQFLLDQLSYNYNANQAKHKVANTARHPYIYSWDATPINNEEDQTQVITTKAGCGTTANKITRPDGSGAGIKALAARKFAGKTPCIDFARSSRDRSASDPQQSGPNGNAFITLARDAETYASVAGGNVPGDLTVAQLKEIFSCEVVAKAPYAADTWGALVGSGAKSPNAKIDPVIPQLNSGTLAVFYTALGLGTPAAEPTCGSLDGVTTNLPEENEGTDGAFYYVNQNDETVGNPNVIVPFSIGAYIEQADHSRLRGHKLGKGQNHFGYNQVGVLHLNSVKLGSKVYAPTTGKGSKTVINARFDPALFRILFDVVEYAKGTKNHIPANMQAFFDPAGASARHQKVKQGWFCEAAQQKVIEAYGFLPSPACGFVH